MARDIKLSVKGVTLPVTGLKSISVSDALDKLDELEARYVLTEVEVAKLAKIHGESFQVQVIADKDSYALSGVVIEVGLEKNAVGSVTLIIRGIDQLHKLKRSWASKAYEGKHSDAVEAAVKAAGASAAPEGVSGTATTIIQANVSAAQFVRSLAKANNYAIKFADNKVQFMRRGGGAKVKVDWGDMNSFKVNHSLDGIVSEVKVVGYDHVKGALVSGTAAAGDATKISGGSSGPELVSSKLGAAKFAIDNSNVTNTSEADALAKAELQRRADRFVRGSFVTVLTPLAHSGDTLTIENAPWPIAGNFLIEEVVHSYISGGRPQTRIFFSSDSLPK